MFYQALAFIFKTFFKLFYTLEVKGIEHRPTEACIVAPNHSSFLDPPLVSICQPTPMHFFARKTLFKNRLFAYFLKKLNAHPIASGAEGVRALAQARRLLESGETVVLFPEGTRSKDGTLLPLRTGVVRLSLKSKVPITPIYIDGAYEIWPRESTFPKIGGKVTVTFGPALHPNNYLHISSQEATEQMLEDLQKSLVSMSLKSK